MTNATHSRDSLVSILKSNKSFAELLKSTENLDVVENAIYNNMYFSHMLVERTLRSNGDIDIYLDDKGKFLFKVQNPVQLLLNLSRCLLQSKITLDNIPKNISFMSKLISALDDINFTPETAKAIYANIQLYTDASIKARIGQNKEDDAIQDYTKPEAAAFLKLMQHSSFKKAIANDSTLQNHIKYHLKEEYEVLVPIEELERANVTQIIAKIKKVENSTTDKNLNSQDTEKDDSSNNNASSQNNDTNTAPAAPQKNNPQDKPVAIPADQASKLLEPTIDDQKAIARQKAQELKAAKIKAIFDLDLDHISCDAIDEKGGDDVYNFANLSMVCTNAINKESINPSTQSARIFNPVYKHKIVTAVKDACNDIKNTERNAKLETIQEEKEELDRIVQEQKAELHKYVTLISLRVLQDLVYNPEDYLTKEDAAEELLRCYEFNEKFYQINPLTTRVERYEGDNKYLCVKYSRDYNSVVSIEHNDILYIKDNIKNLVGQMSEILLENN